MTSLEVSKLQFNVDLDEIEALNQKRTLAFINHWVYHTVLFLNQFSRICEERLLHLETKLQRASNVLSILECKLSSIPGMNDVCIGSTTSSDHIQESQTDAQDPETSSLKELDQSSSMDASEQSVDGAANEGGKTLIPIFSHPLFAPFFKMVNFGVPREAVKLKMTVSGLDPALLDNPSAQVEHEENEQQKSTSSSEPWH